MHQTDPARKSDEELTELLFIEEDRLNRQVINEILARAETTAPILAEIVMDKHNWLQDLPEWWAPVHATYLLGALGDPRGVAPLMAALRWADAFDNDWVTDFLPAIFGTIGPPCLAALEAVNQGLCFHQMAGFSRKKLAERFGVPEGYEVMAAIAVGYPGKIADLPPEKREAETAPRERRHRAAPLCPVTADGSGGPLHWIGRLRCSL